MKNKPLIIIGSGGHASVVLDAAKLMREWDSIQILDQQPKGVVINVDDLYSNRYRYKSISDVFVAIGDNRSRGVVLKELIDEGFSIATIVHPSAMIADSVSIKEGTCVLAGVVINPYVKIGKGVVLNTGARLDHHNLIGDFSHICPGTVLAGDVKIGSHCFIGIGSVVSGQVQITDNVILGAGCVVVKSITESGTYVGTPAKQIK